MRQKATDADRVSLVHISQIILSHLQIQYQFVFFSDHCYHVQIKMLLSLLFFLLFSVAEQGLQHH